MQGVNYVFFFFFGKTIGFKYSFPKYMTCVADKENLTKKTFSVMAQRQQPDSHLLCLFIGSRMLFHCVDCM